MTMREFVTRRLVTGGHGWAGLTELQGVTVDFWGGPQSFTSILSPTGA